MPEFCTPFSVMHADRKLTGDELLRAIRFMIAAEYEASQLYTQMAESIDHPLAKAVLLDISEEELVHAGEFFRLLHELAPNEKELYASGAREVEEMIAKLKAVGRK
ncbi:ferritin family protein [Victivallis sp. Marseille-Q1083]|uniref:ferritin family protein n=1 Tax=Victivallis sp. Marseille-Q1083 TaxID=2717288 RepID=UPI0015892251|nr:ferritin family protein [Victivallis sp. Marseille-Q1083]